MKGKGSKKKESVKLMREDQNYIDIAYGNRDSVKSCKERDQGRV